MIHKGVVKLSTHLRRLFFFSIQASIVFMRFEFVKVKRLNKKYQYSIYESFGAHRALK